MTRICATCGIEQDISEYWKHPNCTGGRHIHCKTCYNSKRNAKYAADEELRKRLRVADSCNKRGITVVQYEAYRILQDYSCAICHVSEKDLGHRLHIDHCHTADIPRGLLCPACNTMLGQAKDSVEILKNAIDYLLNPLTLNFS